MTLTRTPRSQEPHQKTNKKMVLNDQILAALAVAPAALVTPSAQSLAREWFDDLHLRTDRHE